jgi:xanthine dehydrogenase accessory factor
VGFEVTVIDDRPAFANPDNLPEASQVRCGDIGEELDALTFMPRDFVVIVTRGHKHDGLALARCIHHDLAYLGLIGSRRKGLLLRQRMLDEVGASEAEVARVVTPMGLDLGGTSVEEIALSICAQLVAVRRTGSLDAPPLHDARIIRLDVAGPL